ncbi:response regulator [Leptolyngbya sp. FACHB-541]|uniref:response regulator n=1 Tax=Leptolyngbya sp. FACHB-541 TaxID=2692810 RepID=UPI0016847F17|nr:response regulator [Leptolyngbya sp. FACHB-541]
MSQPLHILLIDDNQDDRFLTLRELRRKFSDLEVREILDAKGFEEALNQWEFDLVITDYQLGWSTGIELLHAVKSRFPDCPVVMFTNTGNEEIAVEAMKSGLDDYIVKAPNRYMRVPVAVNIALERAESRRAKIRLEAERSQLLEQERTARTEAETANRLKDEFLATLSHELRTPLNAMLGWVQLLRMGNIDEVNHARAVKTIERNTQALTRLIEDLLDVSRIITGKLQLLMQPTDLATVIRAAMNSIRPAAAAKAIALQLWLDPQAEPVVGDSMRLQQIMWNLLSNAVKFTPEGGRVEVNLTRTETMMNVVVRDTGQGISPDFIPYVFDRFRQADSSITRRQSGLGLGLAIVRHLVELHGGTVQVESAGTGQGSTFTVSLPRVREDTVSSPIAQNLDTGICPDLPGSRTLSGARVLVVDDEPDTCELLALVLGQCELEIRTTTSLSEAIELFGQFDPEVLISNMMMPGEADYALIRYVRDLPAAQGGQIPAIALTSYARQESSDRILAEGFQSHFSKPIEPERLLQTIADLLGHSPTEA